MKEGRSCKTYIQGLSCKADAEKGLFVQGMSWIADTEKGLFLSAVELSDTSDFKDARTCRVRITSGANRVL